MIYSHLDNTDKEMSKIPQHRTNGGLYTGKPAAGSWGSVPVIPDEIYLNHVNLKSANPPVNALTQFTNGIRPGNNMPQFPNIHAFSKKHDIICTGATKSYDTKNFDPTLPKFQLL
jgi:hypothetical protein